MKNSSAGIILQHIAARTLTPETLTAFENAVGTPLANLANSASTKIRQCYSFMLFDIAILAFGLATVQEEIEIFGVIAFLIALCWMFQIRSTLNYRCMRALADGLEDPEGLTPGYKHCAQDMPRLFGSELIGELRRRRSRGSQILA